MGFFHVAEFLPRPYLPIKISVYSRLFAVEIFFPLCILSRLGIWLLELVWDLGLGVWDLELPPFPPLEP